jgi:hypothetical protein
MTRTETVRMCECIAKSLEEEIQAFDEHRTFDEERQRVFRLGMLHAITKLGYAIRNEDSTSVEINSDYETFIKKYEAYQTMQNEKAHQISMEEYLEEKNKQGNIDILADKIAEYFVQKLKKDK